jgi:hypothetical protein
MPSAALSGSLTRLLEGATQRQKNQNTKNNKQNRFADRIAFHHFTLLKTP